MKCKHCHTKIDAGDKKCPKCKRPVPQEPKNRKKTVIMFSCVAVLVSLGVALLIAMLGGWNIGSWFTPKENNIFYKKDYYARDRKVSKNRDEVVATAGDNELTNAMLQIYYWRQVYDFKDTYGENAAYFGLDFSKDLAEQTYLDGTMTWQQYFLQNALQMWQTNQAFAELAEKNHYQLPEEYQDFLENVDQHLQDVAQESGYASAEEMIGAEVGNTCTAEDYAQYLQVYYYGYLYFRDQYDALDPSEEEIEQYFQDNKEKLEESGVSKDGSVYVDFRHIMLYPEGGQMYPDGGVYYTQEAWDDCEGLAESLLATWRNGEKTEESFAQLAKEYSQDETTRTSGGMYTDTVTGDLMKPIETWCFDSSRKAGDCTVIKSDYGYHLIYFVESEEIWHAKSRNALEQKMGQEMVDTVLKDYVLNVDYKKIVLGKVEME